jgi:3-oxoacyl-[acyl-carrier protein] reductase
VKGKMTETKNILITGGGRGIGAATAVKFAAEGHNIIINYRSAEADALKVVQTIEANGGKAISLKGDVSRFEDMKKVFQLANDWQGSIGAVVHCAAPNPIPKTFGDLDWETVAQHFDVQAKGAYNCFKLALPDMVENKKGAFVLLGSIFTDGIPPINQTAYIMAKSALGALAKSVAVEFGPKGIRVNTVNPGMTQTEMIASIPEKAKMLAKMNTPLRRLADPDDIANVISFLVSSAAAHITGENIKVCGGLVMS